jgi:hypothetical protein
MTIQVRDATERGRYIVSSHRVFDKGKEQSYSAPSKCGFFRDNVPAANRICTAKYSYS